MVLFFVSCLFFFFFDFSALPVYQGEKMKGREREEKTTTRSL